MKAKFDADTFVKTWLQAHKQGRNQMWVAKQLGVGHTTVSMRAFNLRKRGVKLPDLLPYNSGEKTRLNKLIEAQE